MKLNSLLHAGFLANELVWQLFLLNKTLRTTLILSVGW